MNNIVSTFYTVTQRPTLTELSSNRQHRTRRADRSNDFKQLGGEENNRFCGQSASLGSDGFPPEPTLQQRF